MPSNLPSIAEAVESSQSLQFFARRAVEGTLSGLHVSDLFGSSIEFAEHKPYSVGDDLRHIDWKMYGRTDKHFLKRFEEETNLRAYLVVDASASMDFGTIGHTKAQYATVLSAVLSYLILRQQDLVSLLRFGRDPSQYLPPRAGMPHFSRLTEALEEPIPGGEGHVDAALQSLMERIHRRAAVVVISDFITPLDSLQMASRILQVGGHDVAWVQLLDPAEVDFPYEEALRVEGTEGESPLETSGREARRSYVKEVQRWKAELKSAALSASVRYHFVRTDEPIASALGSLLS